MKLQTQHNRQIEAPASVKASVDSQKPAANKIFEVSALDHYANNKSANHIGMLVLLLGLGGFLAWAAFAPLDEGVPTEGIVNIESNHRAVQHLTGGIVRQLLVKENQWVSAGDVLVVLDDAATKARVEEIKQRYMGLRAQESRLIAEKLGNSNILFHADLVKNQADPFIQQHMLNQTQLLQARQQALAADIASLNASMQGQAAQIEGYQGVLHSYQLQLTLLNDQLSNVKPLVQEGYAPRNQQNELEQKVAQLLGQIASTQASIIQSKKTILELNQRMHSRQQTEKKDINTQMAQVKFEVQSDAEKFKSLEEELHRMTIISPVTGQVVGLQIHTVGAVIQPGQKTMDVVPTGAPLILDAKIPPHLIDKVRAGQTADVRFSTFANAPQLLVEGKVETISSDLLTVASTNSAQSASSYYLARVSITPKGMQTLGARHLQPGMPVQIVINTGERTLLTYLLHPLTKRIAASMKEE